MQLDCTTQSSDATGFYVVLGGDLKTCLTRSDNESLRSADDTATFDLTIAVFHKATKRLLTASRGRSSCGSAGGTVTCRVVVA
jgi:hypothetical protein